LRARVRGGGGVLNERVVAGDIAPAGKEGGLGVGDDGEEARVGAVVEAAGVLAWVLGDVGEGDDVGDGVFVGAVDGYAAVEERAVGAVRRSCGKGAN